MAMSQRRTLGEVKKYITLNENKDIACQNLWDTMQ